MLTICQVYLSQYVKYAWHFTKFCVEHVQTSLNLRTANAAPTNQVFAFNYFITN